MAKVKYKKPSIQEVIFETKFDYNDFDVALPGQFFEKIKNEFPEKKNLHVFNLKFGPEPTRDPQIPRFQAWKEDRSALLQIGPGIVVANEFGYSSWENFVPIISKALNAYIDCAKPNIVTRIGIRYINKFSITDENPNINEYFNFGVYLPPDFTNLNGFNLSFLNKIRSNTLNEKEFDVNTTLSTMELPPGEKGGKLLLDIDCFYSQTYTPNLKEIISLCNEAHDIIYVLFESFLKDKMRLMMEKNLSSISINTL